MAKRKGAMRLQRRGRRARSRGAVSAALRCMLAAVLACGLMLPVGFASADAGGEEGQGSAHASSAMPLTLASSQEEWDETGKWKFEVIKVDGAYYASILGCSENNVSKIEIPQSITGFADVDGVRREVTLDVTCIGDGAFNNYLSLESVSLPSTLTSIGASAFAGCTHLESVSLPSSVTSVGASAFERCANLTSADFSHAEQLAAIPDKCFYRCAKLTAANIPASAESIGESAFENCALLSNLTIGDPSNLATIGISAFKGCAALEEITLPFNLDVIGDMAFANCSGLESLTFDNPSMTSIGVSAFEGCSSLEEVYLPDKIETLWGRAFAKCTALKLVAYGKTLPGTVRPEVFEQSPIEMMIFPSPAGDDKNKREGAGWNESMAYLTIAYDPDDPSDSSDASICKIVPGSRWTSAAVPATIRKHKIVAINREAAKGQTGLTGVVFPDDCHIARIGLDAFYGCTKLQSIVIPASVKEFDEGVFRGCNNLWDITSKTTELKEIPAYAFGECAQSVAHQVDLEIPEGVTTISSLAFENFGAKLPWGPCPNISLPTTLATIEYGAFYLVEPRFVTMPDAQGSLTFGATFSENPDKHYFLYEPELSTYRVTFGSWSEGWLDDLIENGIFYSENKVYVPVDLPEESKWQVTENPDYTGGQVFPTLSAVRMNGALKLGTHYTLAPAPGDDCTSPGEHQVVVTGLGPCFNSDSTVTLNYTIGSAPLSGDNVKMSDYGPFIWDADPYPGGSVGDPTFTIELAGKTIDLKADDDYTLEYDGDTTGPGTVTVTLKAKSGGLYTGSQAFTYEIKKADLKTADVVVDSQTYTGNPLKPKPTVARLKDRNGNYPEELNLVEGENSDYTITSYENNVNAGKAKMVMTATGVCIEGDKTVEFTIKPADIGEASIADIPSVVYDGEAQEPDPVVTWNGLTLKKDKDYTVGYAANVDVGTASVTVKGKGNFTGTKTATFAITQRDISGGGCTVIVPYSVYAEGKVYEPHPSSVTVEVPGGKVLTLAEGAEYTCIRWEHQGQDRFGYLTIEGMGNFKGECRSRFEIISDGNLSRATIGAIPDKVFTGGPIEPDLVVRFYDVDLLGRRDAEFSAKFVDNVNVGTATVTLTGLGEITGTNTATFEIVAADIKDAVVAAPDQVYSGAPLEPVPTVSWNKMLLKAGKDFEVIGYTNNVRTGTATVTVKGKGNFKGTASGTFEIGKRSLNIVADSAERAYDGTPLVADGTTAKELGAGDRIASVTVEGSQTEVGSSLNKASDAKIANADGEDVTDDYTITYQSGTLEITPRDAVITVDNASKVCGEADPVFSGAVEGLVAESDLGKIRYVRVGDDEAPGTYAGVLTAEYTANPNYAVNVVNGDFTIKASYEVVWLDGDGSQLDRATWIEGEAEPKTGKVPVKKEDAEYTYSFAGWDGGTWDAAHAVKTYTPRFDATAKPGVYRVVSGADSTRTQGSGEALTFVIKRTVDDETTFDHFVGVEVDGRAVPEKDSSGRANWTVERGSVILTLQPTYLDALSAGEHTVTALFDDEEGGTSASFAIAAKASYTVAWLDGDGTVLDQATWVEGEAEPKTGKVPVKKEDAEYTYSFAGWDGGAWDAAHAVKTYAPRFDAKAKPGVYRIVSGADGTWAQGSGEPLTFVIKRTVDDETTFDHFVGVEVDGKGLSEKDSSGRANWTAERGSVILTLQPTYLDALSAGEHTVTVLFDDEEGGTSASFAVTDKASPTPTPDSDDKNKDPQKGGASAASAKGASPATGDQLVGVVAALAIAAACAFCLALVALRRRKRT